MVMLNHPRHSSGSSSCLEEDVKASASSSSGSTSSGPVEVSKGSSHGEWMVLVCGLLALALVLVWFLRDLVLATLTNPFQLFSLLASLCGFFAMGFFVLALVSFHLVALRARFRARHALRDPEKCLPVSSSTSHTEPSTRRLKTRPQVASFPRKVTSKPATCSVLTPSTPVSTMTATTTTTTVTATTTKCASVTSAASVKQPATSFGKANPNAQMSTPVPVVMQTPTKEVCKMQEMANKMMVLHCGTVIDIQGSQGFIIPHDLAFVRKWMQQSGASSDSSSDCSQATDHAITATIANARLPLASQFRFPLVIPFDLLPEMPRCQDLVVGKMVEFSLCVKQGAAAVVSSATGSVENQMMTQKQQLWQWIATDVVPLAPHSHLTSDEDLHVKSRAALRTCKLEREQLFAKAMEDIKTISPRNKPVAHQIDLIKYAENLDDDLSLGEDHDRRHHHHNVEQTLL